MRRKWVKETPENETKMGKIKQDKRLTPDYYCKGKIAVLRSMPLVVFALKLMFGKLA